MLNRGKLWIVPNEEEIIQPLFFEDLYGEEGHLKGIQDFSDKFDLGFNFTLNDTQQAPIDIAERGHLVIKSDEDNKLLFFYIPKKVSDRQLEYFNDNEINYSNTYKVIGSFSLEDEGIEVIRGLMGIRKELTRKNIKNNIKK